MPREHRVNAGVILSMDFSTRHLSWTIAAGVTAALLWLATAGWYHVELIVAAVFLVSLAAPGIRAVQQLTADAYGFDP